MASAQSALRNVAAGKGAEASNAAGRKERGVAITTSHATGTERFRIVRDAAAWRPVCGILSPAFGGSFISFPLFTMGQYFRAVNKTKKEVVCPWCLGGVAKLFEWAANSWGAVFVLLLRRSDGGGGGDFYGYRTQTIELNGTSPENLMQAITKGAAMEGQRIEPDANSVVGRWAGDEVYLVGDYDSSDLYEESKRYRNISRELVEAWNAFMDIEEMQLEYNPTCSCQAPVVVKQ